MNYKAKIIEIRYIAIVVVSLFGIVGVMMLDPIAQDLAYHQFKDQRTVFTIPNFWNVISNLPFFLIGTSGLYSIFQTRRMRVIPELKIAYSLFFFGVLLVAFGSAYYHLSPDNETLVWDRLPMTFAFMALLSIIIGEFISTRIGKLALWPLVIFGVFSIFYWHTTESNGEGDLRLYLLVQFLPTLLIPLILLFFNSKFTHIRGYWYLWYAYVVAKVFEYFDAVVQNNILLLSGHSLKHLVAALGIFFLLKAYNKKKMGSEHNCF
jgi:hypothetical protein